MPARPRRTRRKLHVAARFALFLGTVAGLVLAGAPTLGSHAAARARAVPKWQVVGYGEQDSRLLVFARGDRLPRNVTKGQSDTAEGGAVWSPDGRRIAFLREAAGKSKWFPINVALYVVTVADGRPRRLTRAFPPAGVDFDEVPDPIAWSPDGKLIALAHRGGFEVAPAHGGVVRRVHPGCENEPVWFSTRSASWSPDGRRLVIACARGLWIVAGDGSERHRLIQPDSYGVGAASWSPDGRLIAYGSRCEGIGHGDVMCDLTVVRPDGTGRRTLIRHVDRPSGPSDAAPVWSSDGRLLVPIWGYNSRTVSLDPKTGARRTIYPSAVWELTAGPHGTFAHGGPDVLEIRDRHGSPLLRRKVPITIDDIWLGTPLGE